ncbi:MAG TPA: hypothetical protein PLX18_06425 [Anaerohalosphaeraceae bacterium]|nr:hypothetical protein [Anaerohalosphaeraceae bacterium]HQG04946.1 hypothetical protein [Anaerohalosphaeraceae bacterium]HQI07481.1 hypothetical protein [Anaerohalosphaeraceae bacterium]HQJ67619.1 hypothetical protein [Anaerohalosphaeraceae bacterium]
MLFRWTSIIVLLLLLAGIAVHILLFPFSASGRWTFWEIIRTKIHALTLLLLEQKLSPLGRLRKLVLLLALLAFAILFLTGFGPLLFGSRLSGWLLMIHATFAPILMGCLALLAIGWAHEMVFRGLEDVLLKLYFWILLTLSLPLALSMIVSMFNWFGTEGQDFLYVLHRWCALAFTCLALLFLYILVRRQIGRENRLGTFE